MYFFQGNILYIFRGNYMRAAANYYQVSNGNIAGILDLQIFYGVSVPLVRESLALPA